ncbi:hypothetical protein [Escherichia phage ES]|nr:hypothetical protein [Escherichia phage ES]
MATIYTGKFYESRKTGYEYELVITDDGYALDDGEGYAFEVSPTYKYDLETVKNEFGEKFDEV